MKKVTTISKLACLSLAALALTFASCEKDGDIKKDLKFSPSDKVEVTVEKSASVTVSGGTTPYSAASSDTKVATVSVDKSTVTIKGVEKGTATVTVTDKDKNSGKITVTVKEKEGLTFDKKTVEVEANKEAVVTVSGGTAPYAAESKDATIASATVNDNKITVKGLKAGTTTITVTDKDKKNSGTITVTVK